MRARDAVLQEAAGLLAPHREALVTAWVLALGRVSPAPGTEIESFCAASVGRLLARLSRGEVEPLLAEEALAATEAARSGASLLPLALAIRVFDRCCLPPLLGARAQAEALGEVLLALHELSDQRLEILLQAQEEESARRLVEAQEQGDTAAERARELARANEALRRSRDEGETRARQLALLTTVSHRLAPIRDPERLLQEAAHTIQSAMGHTYVAVVMLDHEGALIGRWAGRPGVGRSSTGRAQGPAAGVIGRALRKRAPQVVGDVSQDPDHHADVPGARSEMVIPLLDGGEAVGAIDFQNENTDAFGLDAVAAGEVLAEFLVVALRNARLLEEARRNQA